MLHWQTISIEITRHHWIARVPTTALNSSGLYHHCQEKYMSITQVYRLILQLCRYFTKSTAGLSNDYFVQSQGLRRLFSVAIHFYYSQSKMCLYFSLARYIHRFVNLDWTSVNEDNSKSSIFIFRVWFNGLTRLTSQFYITGNSAFHKISHRLR